MSDGSQTSTLRETCYFTEYWVPVGTVNCCWRVTSTEADSIQPGQKIIADPGENLIESFRNGVRTPFGLAADRTDWCFKELSITPDHYHPRIARALPGGFDLWAYPAETDREFIARGRDHLSAIVEQLSGIFRVVEPGGSNAQAFGPSIMNLLIVACTEVEAQWKSVLHANGYAGSSTKDYFKTCEALRLKEYSVLLAPYPWLAPIQPFADWSSDRPSGSLAWYDAYNDVKHDRYTNYSKATLSHCISAVSAIAILLVAQFGATALTSEHGRMFEFQSVPAARLEYTYLTITGEWKPSNFDFGRC